MKELNISHDTIKVLKENIGKEISDIPCSNIFTNMFPIPRSIRKNKQMRIHQTKKLLYGQRKHQQNTKGTSSMGIYIYQQYLGQKFDLQNYKELT